MRPAALSVLLTSASAQRLPVVLHAWTFPDDVIGTAFDILQADGGGSALPAVVRGTQQAELNPDVHNVGTGTPPPHILRGQPPRLFCAFFTTTTGLTVIKW